MKQGEKFETTPFPQDSEEISNECIELKFIDDKNVEQIQDRDKRGGTGNLRIQKEKSQAVDH